MRGTPVAAILLGTLVFSSGSVPPAAAPSPIARAAAPRLPLMFEPDAGGASFRARGRGYDISVNGGGTALRLRDDRGASALEMRFGGRANQLRGEQPLTTRVNHLKGMRDDWRLDVPTYAAVRASHIYPGVDALFYGAEGDLEYDLVVAPGAAISGIRLSFVGSDSVETSGGDLHVHAQNRTLVQRRAVAYQDIDGQRVAVPVRYQVRGADVGFEVGRYDETRPLVIDPILSYSTYFGATSFDAPYGIAADATGNAYIAGVAESADMPGPTARPHTPVTGSSGGDDRDAYVAKFRPDGSVEWVTYIGGTRWDIGSAIAVGPDGDVYVAGETVSGNFPTTPGAYQPRAVDEMQDEFLLRLAPDGTTLRYSTLLGAPQARSNGKIAAVAVDAQGRAVVAGATGSPQFPVTIASSRGTTPPGLDNTDAFVARFSADGSRLEFARLLAGSLNDGATALTLDKYGAVYVVGDTLSTDFPVRSAMHPTHFGPTDPDGEYGWDGFLAYVWTDGSLSFSTYLGGNDEDRMNAVVQGLYGRVYVGGTTKTEGLGEYAKPSPAGVRNGIVFEIVPNGSSQVNARYIYATSETVINAMAATSDGKWIWVLGVTEGVGWSWGGYPDPPAQEHPGGGADLFLQKISSTLDRQHYSDLFGGAGNEAGTGIALNPTGDVYISGYTNSTNFPLKDAAQTSLQPAGHDPRGPYDGVVAKFACNFYELGPVSTQPAAGGNGKTWTMVEDGCVMTAVSEASWLHVTGYEPNAVTFSVDANPSPTARTGYIVISGRDRVPVTQYAGSAPPAPSPGPADVVLNPHDATLIRGTWNLVPDDVHGQILTQPDGGAPKVGTAAAFPANYFEFTFYAEANTPYHLWIHGRAQNDAWQNDSVWVQFSDAIDASGAAAFRIGSTSGTYVSLEECSGCGEQGWGWQDNAYGTRGDLGPNIRFATAGTHTIRVQQREDGFDIGQIVLSPQRYLQTAPGGATNDPTIVASEPPDPATHDEIVLWTAWHAQSMHGTWQMNRSEPAAAGGATIFNPDLGAPKLAAPEPAPANYVDITFTADAFKPYHLWLRMKAKDDAWTNDSVWVQFSGSVDAAGNAINRIGTATGTWVSLEECSGCGEQGWGWQDNAYGSRGDLGPSIYFAASGPQTIRVQIREDGLSVDQIVLSAGTYLKSAPGAAKNDATILKQTIQP
jgi:hypothetical protein